MWDLLPLWAWLVIGYLVGVSIMIFLFLEFDEDASHDWFDNPMPTLLTIVWPLILPFAAVIAPPILLHQVMQRKRKERKDIIAKGQR